MAIPTNKVHKVIQGKNGVDTIIGGIYNLCIREFAFYLCGENTLSPLRGLIPQKTFSGGFTPLDIVL